MRNKKIVGAGATVAVSAALLLGASPAFADEESFNDSAYAISASGLLIVNGTLLGQPLPETAVPGTEINLSPLATVTLNDQTRNADGSLTVTGIELKVLPGRGDGVNETLDSEDRAQLPVLGDLLGVELPTTLATEQDVLTQLTDALGGDLDGALQTVTVGSATCTDRGDDGDDGDNGDGKDDDYSDGDDNGSGDNGDDADSTDDAPGVAPSPTVVQASLPVTG